MAKSDHGQFRDRVKRLKKVRAGDLLNHPKNWRTHGTAQSNALLGSLRELGFIDAVIARETKQGLQIIDGHLRSGIDPNQRVPVLIVDLDDEEAAKALLYLDPISAMADADSLKLTELAASVDTECDALRDLMDGLMKQHTVACAATPSGTAVTSELGNLEHKIIINCDDEDHQAELLDRFDQEGLDCKAMII